jgi:phage antirepressor YoqD-like protein
MAKNINRATPKDWYTMHDVVSKLGKVGRHKLYDFLREQGILLSNNEPHRMYSDSGFFKMETVPKFRRSGELYHYYPVLFVSQKGIDFIAELVREKYDPNKRIPKKRNYGVDI